MAKAASVEPSAFGLKSIRLLESLPLAALEELARQCRWKRITADQRVISREAPDNDVYLVVSGKVRVTAFSAAGREVAFGDLRGGDWFGELAAIDGLSRSADVVAIEDTLVAAMSPALFRRLLAEHAVVRERVMQRLVNKIRELTERVFEFSTLGVQNRLHAELLRLARQAGVEGNRARIDPAPKHTDIAGHISTYREQVTRELSAMVKQGLIQRSGTALVIPNVQRLENVVSEVRRVT
ncbi:MAG TPA: Crp/Fnr family transcriptional regulator [Burkholderiales bacterium]|nr:Crp/Fnr family transcriptional regulator [Burkholderiales bacterium]